MHTFSNPFLFSEFWMHLNFCANLMNDVCDIEVDKTKVRSALNVLGTSFLSFRGWEELTSDWNIAIGKTSLSAVLYYLFEGAIPMVTSLCSILHRTIGVKHAQKPSERESSISNSIWNFFSGLQVKRGN